MVDGELGRFSLSNHINVRMIGFWLNIKSSNKLSSKVFRILLNLKNSKKDISFKCLNHIEDLCNSTGMKYLLNTDELNLSSEFINI